MDISYLDLIKLVHPDTCGPYSSTERAKLVNLHRFNLKKLKSLAIEWGILTTPKPWSVPARRLNVGDVISYLIIHSGRIVRKEALIAKIFEKDGEIYGNLIGPDGTVKTFSNRMLKTFKVKFKEVCQNPDYYVTKAKMKALTLVPNKSYVKGNKWVKVKGLKFKVHHTDDKKVYLSHKYGIIGFDPRALKLHKESKWNRSR